MDTDLLIAFFERYVSLTLTEKHYLRKNIPIKAFEKNEMILLEGSISRSFYFILKGAVRLFYTVDGAERTAFFYLENTFVSSYESFTKQMPAKHNLQAIEDTITAEISQEVAMEVAQLDPKFEFLARVIMEEELVVYQDIISSFITMNAEERYLKILKEQGELLQRIPQHQLATYLGVSPETLSRIRK